MAKYGICATIPDRSSLARATSLADAINAKLATVQPPPDAEGNVPTPYCALAGVVPEAPAVVYVAIGASVPNTIKNRIQGNGGNYVKCSLYMWLGGQALTEAETRARVRQWAGEEGCSHVWEVDIDTDTATATPQALLAKFVPV